MIRFLVAAPYSGSGKTTITCTLLALLKRRGYSPCAFKCGPDYIDPMFHRSVLGVDSHNLDLYLSDEECVRRLYARYAGGVDSCVVEGVMGYYDGVGGTTDQASSWHLADTLGMGTLLVVEPKGNSLTLAAELKGLLNFRLDSRIRAILLNNCSRSLYNVLKPMLEEELGLPVVGYLPHLTAAEFESRHLGLLTAVEIKNLSQRIDALALMAEKTIDATAILRIFDGPNLPAYEPSVHPEVRKPRIGVACDWAFCFCYRETLDALEDAGAEIIRFSPLTAEHLPEDLDALYLPGGYPELYAERLAENTMMRHSICNAVKSGMPTLAECGGFLYLGKTLEDETHQAWNMAGVLPGEGIRKDRPVRFGYVELTAKRDNLLLNAAQSVRTHSFHYWESTAPGDALLAEKPVRGTRWETGFATSTLFAAFEHLYLAGQPDLAKRFVEAARNYQHERT